MGVKSCLLIAYGETTPKHSSHSQNKIQPQYCSGVRVSTARPCITALVCSPMISNDWQPWKPSNKLTKISYPVKIWERFNTMGAIIYSGEFIGSLFEFYAINLSVLCSCFAQYLPELIPPFSALSHQPR